MGNLLENVTELQQNIQKIIKGKDEFIELMICAFLAQKHILLEDIPGVGKTSLAKALSSSINCSFSRIQFTPDLLPSDILGNLIFNVENHSFTFNKGPIFNSVVLADEVNRASPRTQAALLEAMAERQVTINDTNYKLDEVFCLIATQNPIEFEGTNNLPEAQLDRFAVCLTLGYPSYEDELALLQSYEKNALDELSSVFDYATLLQVQEKINKVFVDESIYKYVLNIISSTRVSNQIALGASPRASIDLIQIAKSYTFLQGRDYVIPDDISFLSPFVLAHRIKLLDYTNDSLVQKRAIIDDIIKHIKPPQ